MTGKDKAVSDFVFYLRAGYSYFFVTSYEMSRCSVALDEAARNYVSPSGKSPYTPMQWDITMSDVPDAEAAFEKLVEAPTGTVGIFHNFNWFLKDEFGQPNRSLVSLIQNQHEVFTRAEKRKALVIVSDESIDSLPTAIRRDFLPINFDLPGEEEIGIVLKQIIEDAKNVKEDFRVPDEKLSARLIDAALGLSLREVENAFAYSIVKCGELVPSLIDKMKARIVETVAGVKYAEFDATFDTLKGYDNLKKFVLQTINHKNAHGIILLGPAGTGKTVFCQCLANETKKRMLEVEMSEFQGSLVGETERKVREAIAVIRAMAGTMGVIVFVDEIEKGLAGAGGGRQTVSSDSITRRAMAQWLKFMSNPGANVYFIATCNDVRSIPPEYLRAERWDTAPFFVDLPDEDEREAVLFYYRNIYKTKGDLDAGDTVGWSGAELKAVCRISNMMRVPLLEAKKFVVPVSETMKEEIELLRKWAKGRTIPATISVKTRTGLVRRAMELS